MVQLSATSCCCIAILWVSLVSFAAATLRVASQRVSIVVYFVTDSVRKLLVIPSYKTQFLIFFVIKLKILKVCRHIAIFSTELYWAVCGSTVLFLHDKMSSPVLCIRSLHKIPYPWQGRQKVKLSLYAMKAYWGSGGIALLILWPRH
jgi:hypothetical protein